MKKVIDKSDSRGHSLYDWLDSHHTFSFDEYYNPRRMNFGALRVLNDDRVAPGKGFGTHPHKNMEIISLDEMKRDKIISYHRTRARFEEIDRVVKLFAERKEFHVIRMYYFGEDAQGNERPAGAEPYTWEAIAAELEGMGLIRDAKSARRWRNKIVNDMAVCMFGKPAAVGVGTYRKERDRG